LALPVVSLAMLLSFISGMIALISPIVAFIPGVFADLLLRWMIGVAETATAIPFSSTIVAAFPAWVAATFYVPLTLLAIWCSLRTASQSQTS
jgi:hypothetical protein